MWLRLDPCELPDLDSRFVMNPGLGTISAPIQRHLRLAPLSTYLRCLLLCAVLLLFHGASFAELRAIDLDGLRPQRRVGGNNAPSREQLEAGAALLDTLKRIFSTKELSPDNVRKAFGFALVPTKTYGPGIDRYTIETSIPHVDVYRSIYSVFAENNHYDLRLGIDDQGACISEELLKQHWGNDFARMALPPAYAPHGFSPSRAMRNPPEVFKYTTPYGLSVGVLFEYACASSIGVSNEKPRKQEAPAAEDTRQPDELIAIEPQFMRPSVDERLPQTFVVNLSTAIPPTCIALQARGFMTIVLDRALLERLSAQRPKTWRNENERMALIHGSRARRLLTFDGAASDNVCSTVISQQQIDADARYLVADLLAAGKAFVFHERTSKTLDQIEVTYESNRSCFDYTAAGVHFFRSCSFATP